MTQSAAVCWAWLGKGLELGAWTLEFSLRAFSILHEALWSSVQGSMLTHLLFYPSNNIRDSITF